MRTQVLLNRDTEQYKMALKDTKVSLSYYQTPQGLKGPYVSHDWWVRTITSVSERWPGGRDPEYREKEWWE